MTRNVKRRLPALLLALGLFSCAGGSLTAADRDLDLFSGKKWQFYPGYEFPGAKGNQRLETVDGRDALIIS